MWSIIECQLKVINNETINQVSQVYHYWINLNSVNILNETFKDGIVGAQVNFEQLKKYEQIMLEA